VREVKEETGLDVEIGRAVNVYSDSWGSNPLVRAISIVFEVQPLGGELQAESDGSSDQVEWIDLDRLPGIRRTELLDSLLAAMGYG